MLECIVLLGDRPRWYDKPSAERKRATGARLFGTRERVLFRGSWARIEV